MVKEGRILYFLSGYRRFKLITIIYDEKSCLVDKRFEISNHDLIKDFDKIVQLVEVLNIEEGSAC